MLATIRWCLFHVHLKVPKSICLICSCLFPLKVDRSRLSNNHDILAGSIDFNFCTEAVSG